jgi:hypothetical protein
MSYHCKDERHGFVRHGIEYVGEYDAVARTVIEPDYVDALLNDAMAIRQRMLFIAVAESRVRLQRLCQLDVVTKTLRGLARLKPIISLDERRDLLLGGSIEPRANARKLRTFSRISWEIRGE